MNQEQTIKFAASTAIIAAVFTTLVALLMLMNYYQLKAQDPLELKTLEILVEQLKDEPNNDALRNEIRNLDLLARKAFFTNQWQVKTGRYLLLFGGIVCGFALRFYFSARSKISEPESDGINEMIARTISQRWIIVAGSLLLILSFAATFAITDHLEFYQADLTADSSGQADESIEVIRITDGTEVDQLSGEESGTAGDVSGAGGEPTGADGESGTDATSQTGTASGGPASGGAKPSLTNKGTGSGFAREILANHNGFRGPLGNGVSFHKGIPVDWDGSTGRNVIWKAELSKPGYNSPIIWGDKLYVAGADNVGQVVYCLDRNSGKVLWQTDIKDIPGSPAQKPRVTEDTGLSAPTMTTDGIRVYALFGTGDIVALGLDGHIEWARNLGVPDNHYGHSSSLLTWNNRLLLQYDSNKGGRVLSLDSKTGKTQWDKTRKSGISWASPILAEVDGNYQLVLSADPIVAGYDPETGNELWSLECMMGEVGPSPAFGGGLVFAANEYARMVAIKPGSPPTVVWEDDEYMPEVASPVVSDGLLYIATSYGMLVCYDAASGEKNWEEQMNQGFYASPMVADGKLYAMDMDGIMHIYQLGKELKKLGEPALGESSVSTPAFSEGRIYIRGDDYLYCIGKK
jgi:outer membrane protein assembly factor BamB